MLCASGDAVALPAAEMKPSAVVTEAALTGATTVPTAAAAANTANANFLECLFSLILHPR